jgi:hypothetical protein
MLPIVLLATAPIVVNSLTGIQVLYTVLGIVTGIVALVAGFVKFVWPKIKRVGNFLDDWDGEPAREGVPARPGVMMRLETLEYDVASISHEVHLNSGQSIKDIAQRTEQKVDDLHVRVDAIDQQRESERIDRG